MDHNGAKMSTKEHLKRGAEEESAQYLCDICPIFLFRRQVSRWTSTFFQTDPVHWSSHTSFFSLSLPTTRKEVKRIIRSRNNGRIQLKYLRGHLPHIWIFTSRAWNVEAWANGRENRRLSMRNIFQFWCPGERERILPQKREELSSFICVTWLYSCTVFQQILSPRAASKVGCVWNQSGSHICHLFIQDLVAFLHNH